MRALLTLFASLSLVACGSTGSIKPVGDEATAANFTSYDTVLVDVFSDATKKQNMPEYAGRQFTDIVVTEIKATNQFENVGTVDTTEPTGRAIRISGDITRYAKGNGALKVLVGFGAGSTHFEADVNLTDAETGTPLGQMVVDKNSWALGGAIAASQSVEDFMTRAAKKIAKDLTAGAEEPQIEGDTE